MAETLLEVVDRAYAEHAIMLERVQKAERERAGPEDMKSLRILADSWEGTAHDLRRSGPPGSERVVAAYTEAFTSLRNFLRQFSRAEVVEQPR